VSAFVPFAAAHGALLAGQIADRIFYAGGALPEFKLEIGILVIAVLFVVLAPLLVFAGRLAGVKRAGLRDYGALAHRYVREFEVKWMQEGAPASDRFIGTSDIWTVSAMEHGFAIVRTMRAAPINRDSVLMIGAATFVPLLPLVLTMMPFEELVKRLVGVIFKGG
jgi:hypothetical protein